MARIGGARGGWLRESKQPSSTHPVEKTPQFRASMERFVERASERMTQSFGAQFNAESEASRNAKSFAALDEHAGGPAVALYSPSLDARIAKHFKYSRADGEIYLDVQNVTDHSNPEEIVYNPKYTQRGYITGFPILPVIGARLTW